MFMLRAYVRSDGAVMVEGTSRSSSRKIVGATDESAASDRNDVRRNGLDSGVTSTQGTGLVV